MLSDLLPFGEVFWGKMVDFDKKMMDFYEKNDRFWWKKWWILMKNDGFLLKMMDSTKKPLSNNVTKQWLKNNFDGL